MNEQRFQGIRIKLPRLKRVRFAPSRKNRQSGQAIVLIALMMVLLIGMAALAIDGGGVLFLQRDAQNAADAAALSASRIYCLEGDEAAAITSGTTRAQENGFVEGADTATITDIDITIDVGLDTLPDGAPASESPEDYTRVTIIATKPSYFAQLVYQGPLTVSVEAVSRCTESKSFSTIGAMTGFGACGNNTCNWQGSQVYIDGGMNCNGECTMMGSGQEQTLEGDNYCDDFNFSGDWTSPPAETGPSDLDGNPLEDLWRVEDWAESGLLAKAASLDSCNAADPTDADDEPGDVDCYHTEISGKRLEGVYYLNGPVPNMKFEWGPKGATFIVDAPQTGASSFNPGDLGVQDGVQLVAPYKLDAAFDYSGKGFTPAQVNFIEVMLKDNWLLMMNNYNPGDLCSSSGEAWKLSLAKQAWSGVIYASHAPCEASFSDVDVNPGALVCSMVELSGSSFSLIWNPKILPPVDPHIDLNR